MYILDVKNIKRKQLSRKDHVFSYPFQYAGDSLHLKSVGNEFGSICIYSDNEFSLEEKNLLNFFSNQLSSYLEVKMTEILKDRIFKFKEVIKKTFTGNIDKIEEIYNAIDMADEGDLKEYSVTYNPKGLNVDKPGTYVCKILNTIFQCLKPISVYYLTTCGEDCHLEYKAVSNSGRILITSNPETHIRNIFKSNKTNQKYGHPNNASIFSLGNCQYIAATVTSSCSPIGMFVLETIHKNIIHNSFAKDLLGFAAEGFGIHARYLFQRRYGKLIVNPKFNSRETRVDKGKVFVIMPFGEEWSDYIYNDFICEVVKSEGLVPLRADGVFGPNVLEDIWENMLSANIIIADITNNNPNVFYELGVAHTLGKKVILLTQNEKEIPFDLRTDRCVIYKNNHKGYLDLKEGLSNHLKNRINTNSIIG